MIKVENLNKAFKNTEVLHNISFEIKKGDFAAIMGPSGSGKSTLLYSISGMDSINSGRVLFEGTDISHMKEDELSLFRLNKMGFVFQNAQMLKNLSIFDNITLPGLVAKTESADRIRKRAVELMKKMEIEEIVNRDIREVSGGQLQRASICRAMINKPEILFLDEPTGALNSAATDQVLSILKDLNNDGMTIMTVTHDPRVAARAKKVLYIMDGQIAGCKEFSEDGGRERELDKWLRGFQFSHKF
ncbi:ABC transporter ATP-binding protein [Sedimentibacter saalensis]|uniref:Putative ABC transport system ATP-binding protein n=1 Tax=Sedimentibacter saalensis TaxID=130788 RepID=A0A562J358_9FIRM|nr:ABC transporter ATP-binding protein [Sedimentibacter saalensis]TWH77701.1 putative ABC transport system ATP-binding protein [Sedimentibacter saalensis]